MAGNEPLDDTIVLSKDADFVARYETDGSDPDFPANTRAWITIAESGSVDAPVIATWTAESVGPDYIEFWEQAPSADQIPDRCRFRLMVSYPIIAPATEAVDFCWYRGAVKRKD